MSYIERPADVRAEVLQGATESLVFRPRLDGDPETPDSAFVTVLDQNGGVKVARASVAPEADGSLVLTRAWDTSTYPLGEDYCLLWEFTVGSTTTTERQFFDVVKTKLQCPIDTNDLLEDYPTLEQTLKQLQNPDAARFIRRAWSRICGRIRSKGRRPSLILDSQRLANVTLELSLYAICRAVSKEAGDIWSQRMEAHEKNYEVEWNSLGELRYDDDEDGVASTDEKRNVSLPRFFV